MARVIIPPEYIGDGLYIIDNLDTVQIAINHHANIAAYIDIEDIDKIIAYLQKVKDASNL